MGLLADPFKAKMLTKEDLKWTQKFLCLYSKLGIIPVTFKPTILGEGAEEMRIGKISIVRRIQFKLSQILFTCQTLFISFRTLDYATGGEKKELDWDLVPMMLIFSATYLIFDVLNHMIFDSNRELNTKVHNEILKLRGKKRLK